MGFYQFRKEQLLHSGVDDVWDYISSPANLKGSCFEKDEIISYL
jgi:hypothetical protein